MDNISDKIIKYEQGDLGYDEIIDMFQELVKSGMAWKLQGHYGRTAADLIENGLIFIDDAKEDNK